MSDPRTTYLYARLDLRNAIVALENKINEKNDNAENLEHSLLVRKYEYAIQLFNNLPQTDDFWPTPRGRHIFVNNDVIIVGTPETYELFSLLDTYQAILNATKDLINTNNPTSKMLDNYISLAKKLPHSTPWKVKQSVWGFGMTMAAIASVFMIVALPHMTIPLIAVAVIGLVIAKASNLLPDQPDDLVKKEMNNLAKLHKKPAGFLSFFRSSSKEEDSDNNSDTSLDGKILHQEKCDASST